jgi:hypothetical protein
MSKPISSFPQEKRLEIARKRSNCSGLGGISARNYLVRIGKKLDKPKGKEE